jgi:hypothetical protein
LAEGRRPLEGSVTTLVGVEDVDDVTGVAPATEGRDGDPGADTLWTGFILKTGAQKPFRLVFTSVHLSPRSLWRFTRTGSLCAKPSRRCEMHSYRCTYPTSNRCCAVSPRRQHPPHPQRSSVPSGRGAQLCVYVYRRSWANDLGRVRNRKFRYPRLSVCPSLRTYFR